MLFFNYINAIFTILFTTLAVLAVLMYKKVNNFVNLLRHISFFSTFIVFLLSLFLLYDFDTTSFDIQFHSSTYLWFSLLNIDCYFDWGLDGISIWFFILTTFLFPVCILVSWYEDGKETTFYYFLLILLEIFLLLVFITLDYVIFYIFFEATLIPMFFIIGIWGSRSRRIKAAYYLVLFTAFGSVFMLVSLLHLVYTASSSSMVYLWSLVANDSLVFKYQELYFFAFFIGLGVKLPIYPLHIWLPEAHVEAPTVGSVILAGLLLKLGGYGVLRLILPLFPYTALKYSSFVFTVAILGIIYASFATLVQADMKRIIAYSSVAHMNFVLLGLFSFNQQGLEGAIMLMLGHGLVSSALFILVGCLYSRYYTKTVVYFSGLTNVMPIFSLMFLFFTLGNLSLPGTSNFVGEILVAVGIFKLNSVCAFFACMSMVLAASYSIYLYNRVAFGTLKTQYVQYYYDLNSLEVSIFAVIAFGTLVMGVYPKLFLDYLHLSVINLLSF